MTGSGRADSINADPSKVALGDIYEITFSQKSLPKSINMGRKDGSGSWE
ncbi:hypothetical protein ACQZV8_17995 [Magnetococcales bacterium HHB-1]